MDQEEKLIFGELKEGDKFIVLPVPGDNKGHGGFKITHHIFMKTRRIDGPLGSYENAVKLSTGAFSSIPNSMYVIRVK